MTYPSGPYDHGYGYSPPPPPPKPGVIPLAPLGLGDVLGGAFTTYGRYWKPLLGVAVAAYGGTAALAGGVLLLSYGAVEEHVDRLSRLSPHESPDFADIQPLIISFGGLYLVLMLGMLLSSCLVNAAVPAVVQEAVLGRPVGFGTIWRRAWSRLGSVLGSVFLMALATVLPMLLVMAGVALIVIGTIAGIGDSGGGTGTALTGALLLLLSLACVPLALWLWIKFSLAPAVAVIESAGPMTALRRSSALVRGSWWRVFGYTLLMGLIAGFAALVIQQLLSLVTALPVSVIRPGDRVNAGQVLAAAWSGMAAYGFAQFLVQAFLAPFQPLATALLYIDQRIRRENLAPVLAQAAATPTF